jgi:hypothetical protein
MIYWFFDYLTALYHLYVLNDYEWWTEKMWKWSWPILTLSVCYFSDGLFNL